MVCASLRAGPWPSVRRSQTRYSFALGVNVCSVVWFSRLLLAPLKAQDDRSRVGAVLAHRGRYGRWGGAFALVLRLVTVFAQVLLRAHLAVLAYAILNLATFIASRASAPADMVNCRARSNDLLTFKTYIWAIFVGFVRCFAVQASAEAIMDDSARVAGAVALVDTTATVIAPFGPNVDSLVFFALLIQPDVADDRGPFDRQGVCVHLK